MTVLPSFDEIALQPSDTVGRWPQSTTVVSGVGGSPPFFISDRAAAGPSTSHLDHCCCASGGGGGDRGGTRGPFQLARTMSEELTEREKILIVLRQRVRTKWLAVSCRHDNEQVFLRAVYRLVGGSFLLSRLMISLSTVRRPFVTTTFMRSP
jgi:hypothetical protein